MKIFAVIPAFNEAEIVSTTAQAAAGYVDHVIVVDDGSRQPLAQQLPSVDTITVITHAINLGKGAAMKTGVVAAMRLGAEAIVFLDGDGQHLPSEIPQLLGPLRANTADVVFGVRAFHKDMPIVAKFGNIWLSRALQGLFRIDVRDTQSGFRAFRTEIWPKIMWESPRYSVETEMIVNTGKHHLRWSEVPISTVYLDSYRGTTVLDGIRIFINMISWRLR